MGSFLYVSHETATEDVTAVDSLDGDICFLDRTVETATKHTAAEYATGSRYIGTAFYGTRIATAHDVHVREVAVEVFMFLAWFQLNVLVVVGISALHVDGDVGIALDIGLFTKAATEDTEVRRSHLIIYLFPFVCLVEFHFLLVLSRLHLGVVIQETLDNQDVGIVAHFAGFVATGIDVVVNLELQCLVVVLWRVDDTVNDAGWSP